jgi:hypothetical protein
LQEQSDVKKDESQSLKAKTEKIETRDEILGAREASSAKERNKGVCRELA